MAAVPLAGFDPAFIPQCPKCAGTSLHFQKTRHPYMWGKDDLQVHCYTCGLVKYGEATIRQVFEPQLARWTRQHNEEAAFQVALEKERVERRAREAEAARLILEQEAQEEAERKAQEKARRERDREEAARLAHEQEQARLARVREEQALREKEEAARKVREEQERIERERTEARIARERELARERAARWAEIEVMRKRDAARQANLQRELKRERDTRYREKKRAARLSLSPVAVLPAPVSQPAAPVVVEVGVVEEIGSVSLPMCAWTGCANHATPTSKYCSRTCSNNNARARYAARRAELPAPAPEAKGEVANAELRKAVLARKSRYETRTTTESV